MRFLAVAGLFALLSITPSQARDTINWYTPDFPPGHIEQGPLAGQGYVDQMMSQQLEPQLGGYQHNRVLAPVSRYLHDVVARPDVCSAAISRTPERDGQIVFSNPTLVFLPTGLIVREEDLSHLDNLLDDGGHISMAAYLKQPNVSIGIVSGRAYGPRIDALLAAGGGKVSPISASSASVNLIMMLAAGGRITATVGYSFELVYASHEHPELTGRLVWLPLTEQPESLTSHIGCSNSPLGRRLIADVNKVLAKPETRDQIQSYYEQWLDPSSRSRIRSIRAVHARSPDN